MKKGAILMYPVIFGFLLALAIFYLFMVKIPETSYIGEIQLATLKAMYETEKELVYIDNAASVAGQQAIYELAKNGGFKDKSECGESEFQLWNNKSIECFPDYTSNFTSLFNEKLNEFLRKVSFSLMDSYDFLIEQKDKLKIIGKTSRNLIKEYVIKKEGKELIIKGSYAPIKISISSPEDIKKIYNDNLDLISFIKSEAKAKNIDPYIVMGLITAESSWYKEALRCEAHYERKWQNYVNNLGCKEYFCDTLIDSPQGSGFHKVSCSYGLTQLMYPTAWRYTSFKGKPEDLFDGETSIKYGVEHLKGLFNEFKDAASALAAYNAGSGNVINAKKKCNSDYFDLYYSCLPMPEITGPHVKRILTYAEIFRDIEDNQELKTDEEYLAITGYAVKEEEKEESTITYSVNPSFKINLNYDISDYQNAIDDAKNLVDACEKETGSKLSKCIDDNKNKLIPNCEEETEDEKVVNDFIKIYESCSESNDNNCYCNINLNYDKEYEISYESNTFMINDFEKEYILNLFPFLSKLKIGKDKIIASLTYSEQGRETGKTEEKKIDIEDDLVFYKEEKEILNEKIKTIQIAKKENDKIRLYDKKEIELYDEEKEKGIKECKPKPQRTFKFCYKTDKKVLTEEGMKESVIRFALMFPDATAPGALEVNALNYPNDKYKIILTWKKSDADDIYSYKIYYSEEQFKKDEKYLTIKELNEKEEIKKMELTSEAEEIKINLNECGFPEEAPCKFVEEVKDEYKKEDYKINLESNKLYYTKEEDEYFYVLELENKDYNFLVTAVDDSYNEANIEDKNYKTIKSKNLLPFTAVEDLKVVQDGANVKLTWRQPKYKDGSDFEEGELKTYRIRLVDRTSEDSQKIPSDEAMERKEYIKDTEHIFNNIKTEDYYYSVFAVNNDGIEGEYASYP